MQVNFLPWQTLQSALPISGLECRSVNGPACDGGLRTASEVWQKAQLTGGAIREWQTRQSAIRGMFADVTRPAGAGR
jgi:hypothetical protein